MVMMGHSLKLLDDFNILPSCSDSLQHMAFMCKWMFSTTDGQHVATRAKAFQQIDLQILLGSR